MLTAGKVRLVARRDMVGDYGRVGPGDSFEVDEADARSLIQRGLAFPPDPPTRAAHTLQSIADKLLRPKNK